MSAVLRQVRDSDWPALLDLANESVANVPGAGSQEAWHRNRRQFNSALGIQHQFVAEGDSGLLLGYGALESTANGDLRLFLVVKPGRLPDIGELLYARCLEVLRTLGPRRVILTEYGADEALLFFARSRGFSEVKRFTLPEGVQAVTLIREAAA